MYSSTIKAIKKKDINSISNIRKTALQGIRETLGESNAGVYSSLIKINN